ncbi:MAG TPA: four helix bundle protein [Polyangia bacterium]|jgi:four helix bundle protein
MRDEQATGGRRLATGDLRKGADIADRLVELAAAVIRLARTFPRDTAARHVASQLVRCSTSSGANYEEARAAESRADFVHKLGIAAKELRETIFWLRLVERSAMTSADLDLLIEETAQLAAILVASVRTASRNT